MPSEISEVDVMIGRVKQITAWLGLAGSVAFCMAAGAAGYHQIECAHKTAVLAEDATPEMPVHTDTIINVTTNVEPGGYLIVNSPEQEDVQARQISDSDRDLIAQTIAAEAENQPLEGKILIAHVILNRVDNEAFPDTVEGVISAPGQFATWHNGRIQKAVPTVEDYEAVKLALHGENQEPVFFFRNQHYHGCGKPYTQVGDHYFSTMKGMV